MKEAIRTVSVELLLRHGYQGFRFRDVAERLTTTRANVHYYYGSKQNLCEEVIVEYVEGTIAEWTANWRRPVPLVEKIGGMMESNRERYVRYNPTGDTGHAWSLIGRMRLERDEIGPRAREVLARFSAVLEAIVTEAVARAVRTGELGPGTPVADVALQITAIADSAGAITQDSFSFDRLERLYGAIARTVLHAYGQPSSRP